MRSLALVGRASLRETSEQLRLGRRTCVDLTRQCLEHAQRTESKVRAFVHLLPNVALDQAAALDAELAAGHWRGPLHGIPMAVKDNIDVEGMPTTASSRVLDANPASRDADVVAALREAGVVWLGKTNTHEFAYGAVTPPTRNPWDMTRIPGGSSGGSAAAVAAGSAIAAIGTDTGGSVRMPAALCGVVGFRPRRTAVPTQPGMDGVIPLAPQYDQWGILVPTVDDAALVWSALTGVPPAPPDTSLRIGVPSSLVAALPPVAPVVASAFEQAIRRMARQGMGTLPLDLGRFDAWQGPRQAVQMHMALEVHKTAGWWPACRARYTAEVRTNLEIAEARGESGLPAARLLLDELDARIDAALYLVDVIAVPTVPVVAPTVSEIEQMPASATPRHPAVNLLGQATRPFARVDLASISVPASPAEHKLPVGIQFVGRTEAAVFDAARRLELSA